MLKNMWNLELSDLPLIELPDEIVNQQCQYLKELTSMKIITQVVPYTGSIFNYHHIMNNLPGVFLYTKTINEKTIYIQDECGLSSSNTCKCNA